MNILVTGSNGFVGRNLCDLLVSRGHEVTGLGRTQQPKTKNLRYISHDLTSPLTSDKNLEFDTIVHAAALASPWAHPEEFRRNNVHATKHTVDFAKQCHAKHFIYISSSSVFYERRDQFNLNEDSPIPVDQINTYSQTKWEGEEVVRRSWDGKYTILRPRAVFGPHDTVLLPRIVKAAQAGKLPKLVRRDGKKAIGDLIYIETLTQYICKSIEAGVAGEFNLTNNEPIEIESFVNLILSKLDVPQPSKKIPAELAYTFAWFSEIFSRFFRNYREPHVTRFGISVFTNSKTFDVSRSLQMLGPPAVSLEDGVSALVNWWRSKR